MAKKEQERIAELEKELAKVLEQNAGLKRRIEEMEAAKPKSKTHQQAETGLQWLEEAGRNGISLSKFAELNPKYPSDVPYYVRTLLKREVKRVGKTYYLPHHAPTVAAPTTPTAPASQEGVSNPTPAENQNAA